MVQKSSRLKTASHIMFFEMFLARKFLSFIKFVVESIHVRLPFPNNVQLKGNCQMKLLWWYKMFYSTSLWWLYFTFLLLLRDMHLFIKTKLCSHIVLPQCLLICCSVMVNSLILNFPGPGSFDILQGHSKATMLLIFNNAAQGILSSFFFKYAGI